MSVEVAATLTLLAVALVGLAAVLADRTALPAPVLLAVIGLVYAELPGPNVRLDPDLVLVLVIPPLLYSAALRSSIVDIRSHLREVGLLSVGLVLATALVIGAALHALVPGLSFAAATALGAAVAPNDPIAALAIARSVGLPARLVTVVEGESLLNDASALTTYTVAVAAVGGGFSVGDTAWRFVLAVGGGLLIGLAVGWVVRLVTRFVDDSTLQSVISLATPFAAFLPAEELHASGVLAVVVCGLWLGHQGPSLLSGSARLQGRSVWSVVDLLLEGTVFLLIGVQLPVVLDGVSDEPVGRVALASAVAVAVVVLGRPLWLALTLALPARLSRGSGGLSGRELTALSWAGMRGVVSLAAVFALPLRVDGHALPDRDLLVFVAFVVVLVTLVGQGLTYAPLLRRLDLREDRAARAVQMGLVRRAVIEAGVRRLDDLADDGNAEVVDRLRQQSVDRVAVVRDRLTSAGLGGDPGEPTHAAEQARTAGLLRSAMIAAERAELLSYRDRGELDDAGLRRLQRELDHEERAIAVRLEVPRA